MFLKKKKFFQEIYTEQTIKLSEFCNMMTKIHLVLVTSLLINTISCSGQSNKKSMKDIQSNVNQLICDPQTGACKIPNKQESKAPIESGKQANQQVRVIYFTDPICSSCWGIEPQLRKLKLTYSNVKIEYKMGGLLPDWSYNSGGISKPSDVAHHWDEVSLYYDIPIDGDVWLEDPLNSSYPPSIAFKAAQMQDEQKAILFLRKIREMVFLEKKNITKWEYLSAAALHTGLNATQLKIDFQGEAKILFQKDLNLAQTFQVRGFPTIFFLNESGKSEVVYGSKPYSFYETALLKVNPKATRHEYQQNWEVLFATYETLTIREFAELSGKTRKESETLLIKLTESGNLEKFTTKNGSIWKLQ